MNKIITLVLALVLTSVVSFGLFPNWDDNPIKVTFDEGIEIIRSKDYPINDDLKWKEITATGIKVTEMSLKGFLQFCERLVIDFGNVQVYVDAEVRVMWVYANPTAAESDREIYYAKFL